MKKVLAMVLCLVLALSLAACSDKNMKFDIGDAAKINIKSGLTGDEVTIADHEFIQNITENIHSLAFEKTSTTNGEVSYAYMLTWLDAEGKQIESIAITEENGYQISYDGYYCKVCADLAIDIAPIAEMLDIAKS